MSCPRTFLIALVGCFTGFAVPASPPTIRILFAGDILLSRQVEQEVSSRANFPSKGIVDFLSSADWTASNLEGAVGEEKECASFHLASPCFFIRPKTLGWLSEAGFKALSVENNHSNDLGIEGSRRTRKELENLGLLPLDWEDGPEFLRLGSVTIGVVSLSLIPGRDGSPLKIPSIALAQKLRLSRRLANLTFVSVHWGSELLDWPNAEQQADARWLVGHGADAVFGHHPHVVQAPACIAGRPVFYSLGNFLFDQKYEETKSGLIADCRIAGRTMTCAGIDTETPARSTVPMIAGENPTVRSALAACPVPLANGLNIGTMHVLPAATDPKALDEATTLEGWTDGRLVWRTKPVHLVSLESAHLSGSQEPALLLALEKHFSPLDGQVALRPHVYRVDDKGLVPLWRGSALAWPLLDLMTLPGQDDIVCALHRGDSFLVLDNAQGNTRMMAYRWNGFGFSGVEDPGVVVSCQNLWKAN